MDRNYLTPEEIVDYTIETGVKRLIERCFSSLCSQFWQERLLLWDYSQ